MKDFDSRIREVVKQKIDKPYMFETTIKRALQSKNKIHRRSSMHIGKIITVTSCGILITTGIVFATHTVYEKIWKEPTKTELIIPKVEVIKDPELKNVDIGEYINEEEAINSAKQAMQKLGVEVQDFKKIVLYKYEEKENSEYMLSTSENTDRGINIKINALTGSLKYYDDMDVYKYKQDKITKEEAIERANEICSVMQIMNGDESYEIMNVRETKYTTTGFAHNVWEVSYARKYNGVYDKTSTIYLMFIVSNGKTIPYGIPGQVGKSSFENNPTEITKEEAIEFAINKEKEFSGEKIINVTAEQSIEKMNLFVYCMENNLWNMGGYQIEDRTRNVWLVNIQHHEGHLTYPIGFGKYTDEEKAKFFKEKANKKYYVDATTGEIIGGKEGEFSK